MKNTTAALLGAILAAAILTGVAAAFGPNKPAGYQILSNSSSETLAAAVSRAMNEGCIPLGEATRGTGSEIMQTMLKY